jgi:hypothetical protein
MIVQPTGKKVEQFECGVAVAAADAPLQHSYVETGRVVLAMVPRIE